MLRHKMYFYKLLSYLYFPEYFQLKKHCEVPGPGQYTPLNKSIMANTASAIAGTSKRTQIFGAENLTPGPGAYINSIGSKNEPGFKFNQAKPIDKTPNTPRPGAYRLPSTIVDLPDYAMPEKSKKYHYI